MLEAQNISYAHRKFTILENIDVSVNYGELLVIVGPNGAGKSTLLSILANELAKHEQPIYLKKKAFKEWSDKELRTAKLNFRRAIVRIIRLV